MRISRATTILITALLMLFTACNDKKTYADYLKDEARAIDLFIKKNGLEILDKLPPNGQFKSNQFYNCLLYTSRVSKYFWELSTVSLSCLLYTSRCV